MKLEASQASIAYKYKNIKLKVLKTNENIHFNKKCLELGIIPKYVSIKINSKSLVARKTKNMAEKIWIKNEIKSLYSKKSMLNKLLLQNHITLLNCLHSSQVDNTLREIIAQIDRKLRLKKRSQANKLNELSRIQLQNEIIKCNHVFHPRVMNLSNIKFTNDEMNLLNKGLNFNFPDSRRNNLVTELLQAESAISAIKTDYARNATRHAINNRANRALNNCHSSRKYMAKFQPLRQVAASIKDKLIEHSAVITESDKGGSIVVLPKADYIDKVQNFISTNSIEKINTDPTTLFSKEINKIITKSSSLFSETEMRGLKVPNPQAPILRGMPKIHKKDIPIRPLVNFMPAPAYRLAKKLDWIIRREVILENSQSLKNSTDLISKIRNMPCRDNYLLASFDIVNLYTNVPISETIDILRSNLTKNSSLTSKQISDLVELTEATLRQNYFTFEDEFYIQKEGLAMGSPLSSILSELFLNHIENTKLRSNRHSNRILFYFRYVDDTIVLFNGTSRQLNLLKNHLNSLHPKLQFTLEEETNKSINFLDLTIFKRQNGLGFKIYRKPTTTNQTIHATSHHPYSQKMAAYNSFVHRLLSVPLEPEDYEQEVNTIKSIAISNGYKSSIIDKIINKQKNKITNRPNDDQVKPVYVSAEYGVVLSHTLSNEVKKHNVTVAYKTSNKLSSLLKEKKHSRNDIEGTGVYKIVCDECPSYYIGQTTRSFAVRFKEHLPHNKSSISKSAFASHLVDNNHSYTGINENLQILHKCGRGKFIDALEQYEIFRAVKTDPQNVLNDQSSFTANIIYDTAMRINEGRGQRPLDNR